MNNDFRTRLHRGDKLLGTMVTLTSPAVAEILAEAGFDWLFVDGEHGPFETGELLATVQAVGNRAACIVRVPAAGEVPIKKALDLGADGIIAPQVNSAEEAERVVGYSRYAPEGTRGVGLARSHGYGIKFDEYMTTANEQVTVIVQAEHVRAVENIEAIIKVEGIDAVLIGPYDLSASLGKMGHVNDPAVVDAIDHVTTTCLNAGVRLGMFGVTADAVKPYIEKGYTLIVAGVDTMMLGNAAANMLSKLR